MKRQHTTSAAPTSAEQQPGLALSTLTGALWRTTLSFEALIRWAATCRLSWADYCARESSEETAKLAAENAARSRHLAYTLLHGHHHRDGLLWGRFAATLFVLADCKRCLRTRTVTCLPLMEGWEKWPGVTFGPTTAGAADSVLALSSHALLNTVSLKLDRQIGWRLAFGSRVRYTPLPFDGLVRLGTTLRMFYDTHSLAMIQTFCAKQPEAAQSRALFLPPEVLDTISRHADQILERPRHYLDWHATCRRSWMQYRSLCDTRLPAYVSAQRDAQYTLLGATFNSRFRDSALEWDAFRQVIVLCDVVRARIVKLAVEREPEKTRNYWPATEVYQIENWATLEMVRQVQGVLSVYTLRLFSWACVRLINGLGWHLMFRNSAKNSGFVHYPYCTEPIRADARLCIGVCNKLNK
jgi:hypothetical protein